MILNEDLLLSYGGKYINYGAYEIIFSEGDLPKNYFQIVNGTVELNNYYADGK